MPDKKKKGIGGDAFETKRCPYCSTPLPVNAEKCFACKAKIGELGKFGLAKKPFDWKGYLLCVLSFVGFVVYVWLVFFK